MLQRPRAPPSSLFAVGARSLTGPARRATSPLFLVWPLQSLALRSPGRHRSHRSCPAFQPFDSHSIYKSSFSNTNLGPDRRATLEGGAVTGRRAGPHPPPAGLGSSLALGCPWQCSLLPLCTVSDHDRVQARRNNFVCLPPCFAAVSSSLAWCKRVDRPSLALFDLGRDLGHILSCFPLLPRNRGLYSSLAHLSRLLSRLLSIDLLLFPSFVFAFVCHFSPMDPLYRGRTDI